MRIPDKMISVIVILVISSSIFLAGCGNKTEARYVVPTGHAVAEPSRPVQVSITGDDSEDNDKAEGYVLEEYATVVEPPYEMDRNGSYIPRDASVEEVSPRICSINDVILGYVGCYYDETKTSVRLTLKNSGRGEIDEMWFYIVGSSKGYAKSEGSLSGYINDYKLPILNWMQKYGKIQRILVTPVVEEGNVKYACNNRQLLLLPEVNCREMVG